MHHVYIKPHKVTQTGQTFAVRYKGEVLITSSKDPEHVAARELVDRGFTGEMQTYMNDIPGLYYKDIEKVALKSVSEEPKRGLREKTYRPYGEG